MRDYSVRIKNDKGDLIYEMYTTNHELKLTAINEAVNLFARYSYPYIVDGDLIIECIEVK